MRVSESGGDEDRSARPTAGMNGDPRQGALADRCRTVLLGHRDRAAVPTVADFDEARHDQTLAEVNEGHPASSEWFDHFADCDLVAAKQCVQQPGSALLPAAHPHT